MRKEEMTWMAMLAEAVGLVSAVVYLGLQIFYGVSYGISAVDILMNVVIMLLIYAILTMLAIYPEWVNGLSKEVCIGRVRKYTIRMVRIEKIILIEILLLTSICDVMGRLLPPWTTAGVIVVMVAVAVYYEYRIIRILREKYKK